MTKLTSLFVLLAAGTLLSGTTAFGQTQLRARVPFAFEAARAAMPAGTYNINLNTQGGGATVVRLYNPATKKSAMMVAQGSQLQRIGAETPHMTFRCRAERCSLERITTHQAEFITPSSRNRKHAAERLTYVSLNHAE